MAINAATALHVGLFRARATAYDRDVLGGHPFRDAPARKLLSARIQPRVSRFARFFGIGVVALIWNGLTGYHFGTAVMSGEGSAIAFMSIFVIIGLLLLATAVHALLAMFNPTVELFASEAQPALGETLELRWRLAGKAGRVLRLQVALEGIEEATYKRGTDTTTDRHTFAKLGVAATTDPAEIADGTASVVIPHDAVPSFSAPNNKIVWRLVIQGEIPSWPDIDDEFLVDVVANRRVRAKAAA